MTINELPLHYRNVFELSGKSYNDIAAILNLPLGTVKSRLHRARKMMSKKTMESNNDHMAGADAQSDQGIRSHTNIG